MAVWLLAIEPFLKVAKEAFGRRDSLMRSHRAARLYFARGIITDHFPRLPTVF